MEKLDKLTKIIEEEKALIGKLTKCATLLAKKVMNEKDEYQNSKLDLEHFNLTREIHSKKHYVTQLENDLKYQFEQEGEELAVVDENFEAVVKKTRHWVRDGRVPNEIRDMIAGVIGLYDNNSFTSNRHKIIMFRQLAQVGQKLEHDRNFKQNKILTRR